MHRRDFLQSSLVSAAALVVGRSASGQATARYRTVTGETNELGVTLSHEHILVDFIGADRVNPNRYDVETVVRKMAPYLDELREAGCDTLVECTPAYLGRDPRLLKWLADASGLNILKKTGYYAAVQGKYLPPHAHTESADRLAERWTAEWQDGIDQTGIRPGFIKIGVDAGPLNEVSRKIVTAAARTHKATGLTIAAHTGDGVAAQQQLEILKTENVSPSAWIWVHAQNEKDMAVHANVARAGGWVEFDGIAPDSIEQHIELVQNMRRQQLLERVLISQDAGWYSVGEPNGGTVRPYNTLFSQFIPALRNAAFTDDEIKLLMTTNPGKAFAIRTRN